MTIGHELQITAISMISMSLCLEITNQSIINPISIDIGSGHFHSGNLKSGPKSCIRAFISGLPGLTCEASPSTDFFRKWDKKVTDIRKIEAKLWISNGYLWISIYGLLNDYMEHYETKFKYQIWIHKMRSEDSEAAAWGCPQASFSPSPPWPSPCLCSRAETLWMKNLSLETQVSFPLICYRST